MQSTLKAKLPLPRERTESGAMARMRGLWRLRVAKRSGFGRWRCREGVGGGAGVEGVAGGESGEGGGGGEEGEEVAAGEGHGGLRGKGAVCSGQ